MLDSSARFTHFILHTRILISHQGAGQDRALTTD